MEDRFARNCPILISHLSESCMTACLYGILGATTSSRTLLCKPVKSKHTKKFPKPEGAACFSNCFSPSFSSSVLSLTFPTALLVGEGFGAFPLKIAMRTTKENYRRPELNKGNRQDHDKSATKATKDVFWRRLNAERRCCLAPERCMLRVKHDR